MPAVPVSNLLDTASHPAFRSIDAESFQQAMVPYPADDGYHRVPIGDYLATRIAEAFPRNAEVAGLNLAHYDVNCAEGGFLSSAVRCQVAAAFKFRLWRRPNNIQFRLKDVELGDSVTLEDSAYRVADYRQGDEFSRQIRHVVDVTAIRFKQELRNVLVSMNRQQAF